ncbi:general secretion pathway protein GspD [Chitinimonas arctica]|uniref:General secretion pathway protein GspD n=1 Tax=Chitinimonas arctica TaxID=2594795 RepID=A0A516SBH6_9NEIS|nr:secretin and TonB N-terminal domain-containing protein [Chitinimonas arctica]QDQ25418.1 general secretion pathway protein GspD [Chitinimonas arctica]
MKYPLSSLVALALLGGCASDQAALSHAKQLLNEGRTDEGAAELEQLVRTYPENSAIRATWARTREQQADRLARDGDTLRLNQQFEEAQSRYQAALLALPNHPRARDGLARLAKDEQQAGRVNEAARAIADKDDAGARTLLKGVLADNPRHARAKKLLAELESKRLRQDNTPAGANSPLNTPVTLEFRNAPLSSIFDMLSQSTGVNFVFDREAQLDGRTTIMVRDTPLNDALNVLLAGNQLSKRLLNDHTVMIYPANANRQKDIDPLHVKTFYLGNIEAKSALALIKTIVKTRDIYIDEKLNTLVMRDSPEAIAIAEKLLASQDLADPEVVLDVEVMEISSEKLANLGMQLPDRVSLSVPTSFDGSSLSLGELRALGKDGLRVGISDPALILNLKHTDGAANTLANPRIRVKNREKAKIQIGDRVPVITTTTNPTSGSVAESINYLDVGLLLDVEPQVYPDNEVGIRLNLEVSNIVKEVPSKSGLLTYQIGTRRANTVLRLKDGETQVLAGLIKREEIESAARVPGLGQLPLLGKIFSSEKNQYNRSELVLLITPRIVRNLETPDSELTQFASGTENSVGADPLQLPSRGAKISVPAANGGQAVPPPPGTVPQGVQVEPMRPPLPPPPPPPPPPSGVQGQGGTRP